MRALYMISLPISPSELGRWAATRNYGFTVSRGPKGQLRDTGFDEGRAIHHLLAETFGPGALHPFRLMVAPGGLKAHLYAYSSLAAPALREAAQSFALPEAIEKVCDPAQLAAKLMPDQWRSGRRLGFEIRIRPVSRILKPLSICQGAISKGSEVDVFLLEALRDFPAGGDPEQTMLGRGRSRESVYSTWLARKLDGAASLVPGARLTAFHHCRVARHGSSPEGPDAILQGDLVIQDSIRLSELLVRGVGRHKAYGYGMMLLRPSRGF